MTKREGIDFDTWYSTLVVLVLEGSGVDFGDEDSVLGDYDQNRNVHDVADEIVAEYAA